MFNIFRFLKRKKKKEEAVKSLSEEDIEDLDKELDKERGELRARLARAEVELKKVHDEEKEAVKEESANIPKELYEQDQQIFKEKYKGALSWRNVFFNILIKGKKQTLSSDDDGTIFGNLYDLLTTTDGSWAIVAKSKDGTRPIITGQTADQLFFNYEGLANTATKGFIRVCLNKKGKISKNIQHKKLSIYTLDAEGKVNFSEISEAPFKEQLTDNMEVINELSGRVETYEEVLQKQVAENKMLRIQVNFNKDRANIAEKGLIESIQQTTEIHKKFRDILAENAILGQSLGLSRDLVESLKYINENMIKEVENDKSQSMAKKAKEDLKMILDWAETKFAGKVVERIIEKPPVSRIDDELAKKR